MADPVVHITGGVPDSGTGNITTLGQTLLDGANLTLGATTDAAATGVGTVNAHLRALAGTVSAGALTVSGTFSLPTGASTSANQPSNAALGSTTSGQTGNLSLGAVTTGPPTYVTGQTNALSLDTTGSLRVALTSSFAGGVGTSSADKSAFTAGSTAFTPSGGFFQTTATANPLTPGQMGAWQLTATRAGFVNLRDATGTEIGTTATPIRGAPDGTVWAMTGTSANVNVSNTNIGVTQSTSPWVVSNGGTFAVQLTGATNNINNISGTISLPTGASTSALQPTNAGQGSTTSGQTGHLAMGAVTTGNPTYTTAQTSPLSLDTSGALRVNVIAGSGGGGTSSSFGSAFPATGTAAGAEYLSTPPTLTNGQMVALQTNVSGALKVDGSAITQPVSGTFWQATQPVSGTVTANQGGTWTVQPGNTANTTAWLVTGTGGTFPVTGTFWQATQPVSIASTVAVTQSGTWTVQPGNTANTTPWLVLPALTAASNGLTSSRVNAAASTNATSLKASAGEIGRIDVFNTASYAVFLKLYNKASSPTVGTDTPVWTIPVASGGGYSTEFMRGKYFSTGIAYAITKLQVDSDTTAVAANDLTGSIDWI
jgi:hypothetical protein